jgi:hypothetical protein
LLIVSGKEYDKNYGLDYYKVYFRGYSGKILECDPSDMVDLLDGDLSMAISRDDIGMYTSIAKKNGITINPKYQQALDYDESSIEEGLFEEKEQMKKFTFKAKHDKGTRKISATATSAEKAKELICKAEKCPPHALTLVSESAI